MKLFDTKKIEEVLKLNWTKYIDYKLLMAFIINAVPLYAANWSIIKQYKKIQGNKIAISKVTLAENALLFWVDFEVPVHDGISAGTIELICSTDGSFKINNISGTIFA